MVEELSEETMKNQYELYNRINNKTRKNLLVFIYKQTRNYKELKDLTKLKPGSLYHHLGVLKPLIKKVDHGLYEITDLGKKIVELLDLAPRDIHKPLVQTINSQLPELTVEILPDQIDRENYFKYTTTTPDKLLSIFWSEQSSLILITTILIILLLLGLDGVAFAGSTIYAIGGPVVFLFDVFAIIFGIGFLYLIEEFLFDYPIYSRIKFIVFIRLVSMFPAAIVGISLLLLFNFGIIPTSLAYSIIFAITLIFGTFISASGIYYLRSQTITKSIIIAIAPAMIDSLLGVVVLISV